MENEKITGYGMIFERMTKSRMKRKNTKKNEGMVHGDSDAGSNITGREVRRNVRRVICDRERGMAHDGRCTYALSRRAIITISTDDDAKRREREREGKMLMMMTGDEERRT